MLKDGEKGVVLQRDGRTYAITPHLPCGLVTPEMLRKIAEVAEKFGGTLKCTGAQRIAIVGLLEGNVEAAWAMLGGERPGHMTGTVVRSVKVCPGLDWCRRARQDAVGVGMELDRRYHGRKLPGKMKMGVSGCGNDCSEVGVKDIGLIGGAGGWRIMVGGMCGTCPRLSRELTDKEITTEAALEVVEKVVCFFEKEAREGERLGEIISRVGMPRLRQAAGVA